MTSLIERPDLADELDRLRDAPACPNTRSTASGC